MKKGLWLVIFAVFATAAWGTDKNPDDAWAGCMTNIQPNSLSPQTLAAGTYGYVHMLTSTERNKLNDDGGWENPACYNYYEPAEIEHDWCMVRFTNWGSYTEIGARFRAAIEGGENVNLYVWDGDSWEKIAENEGGTDPDTVRVYVTDYMDDYLYLLIQSRSYPTGRDYWVTLCDLQYE